MTDNPTTAAARDRGGQPTSTTTSGTTAKGRRRQNRAADPPQEQGGYPPQGEPAYPRRQGVPRPGGYPEQGGYPDQGYPPQSYEQRPPAGYGPPPGGGYPDQGYRQAPGGSPPPRAASPDTATGGDYDYGRQPAGRPDDGGYGRQEPRPAYPDQGGYPTGRLSRPGRLRRPAYGRQEYAQPDYGRYGEAPAGAGTPNTAMPSPQAAATTTDSRPARRLRRLRPGNYPAGGACHAAARRRQRPDLPVA